MYSTRGYKIYICPVTLGKLESFRNYKGLRIIFSKILDAVFKSLFYERDNFSDSPLHRILESENFNFPFPT